MNPAGMVSRPGRDAVILPAGIPVVRDETMDPVGIFPRAPAPDVDSPGIRPFAGFMSPVGIRENIREVVDISLQSHILVSSFPSPIR